MNKWLGKYSLYVKSNHYNVDFTSFIVKVRNHVFILCIFFFSCVLISTYCCIVKYNGCTLFKNNVITQKKIHYYEKKILTSMSSTIEILRYVIAPTKCMQCICTLLMFAKLSQWFSYYKNRKEKLPEMDWEKGRLCQNRVIMVKTKYVLEKWRTTTYHHAMIFNGI